MAAVDTFMQALTVAERGLIADLTTPVRIQAFLDTVPYSTEPVYRCPLQVLRDRVADCF